MTEQTVEKSKKEFPKKKAMGCLLWVLAIVALFAACNMPNNNDKDDKADKPKVESKADKPVSKNDLGGVWVKSKDDIVSLEKYQADKDYWQVIEYVEKAKLTESGKYRYVTMHAKANKNGQQVERSEPFTIK